MSDRPQDLFGFDGVSQKAPPQAAPAGGHPLRASDDQIMTGQTGTQPTGLQSYKVLARAYRPYRFDQVIGQHTMVDILSQGLAKGRLGHGFVFSGIRGVGKTTTARLLAAVLNCAQPQQQGAQQQDSHTQGPKTQSPPSGPLSRLEPCGTCPSCVALADGKHMDVLEIDAASHTGVDDIRDILEACRYRPVLSPFKIFIIDEVHMLSKSAFNALLKTLEEPPAHVKFILATTEIRKIPATVLSRCMRFDLKRVEPLELVTYLEKICQQEGIEADPQALFALARAGEGSVRDSLSLLDQAIVLSCKDHSSAPRPVIGLQDVRQMLGLLDYRCLQDLLEAILAGHGAKSVEQARALYGSGLDPVWLLDEIGNWVHHLSCLKAGVASGLEDLSEAERAQFHAWKEKTSLAVLGFLWQMLVKGAEEVRQSPFPQQALEMILLRLAYATQIPVPSSGTPLPTPPLTTPSPTMPAPAPALSPAPSSPGAPPKPKPPVSQPLHSSHVSHPTRPMVAITDVASLVEALETGREGMLHTHLMEDVVVHDIQHKRVTVSLTPQAPREFPKRVEAFLRAHTGDEWVVVVQPLSAQTDQAPAKTLAQKKMEERQALRLALEAQPVVQRVAQLFPGAVLESVEVA